MEVFVVRHTSVDIDKSICYGQLDVGLCNTFEEESKQILNKLDMKFDQIFSSPLSRCVQLSKKFSNTVILDNRLLEINFGSWENRKWSELSQLEMEKFEKDFIFYTPPGGENLQMLYLRVSHFLEELRFKGYHKVLLFTHSGVIRCILIDILQISLQNFFKFQINYGDIIHLSIFEDRIYDKLNFM